MGGGGGVPSKKILSKIKDRESHLMGKKFLVKKKYYEKKIKG